MKDSQSNGRIYGKETLSETSVKSFWRNKASKDVSLKSVLLGADLAENSGIIRNERENAIFQEYVDPKDKTVLDIGCGIGRWAHNLKGPVRIYHGIDFTAEFINVANNSFADYPNIQFFVMSAIDINTEVLLKSYDIITITAVSMYINDEDIERLFMYCNLLAKDGTVLYFQESVSILENRLTLKNFYSKELKADYNAIYRTCHEYEAYFEKYLPEFEIEYANSKFLLDKETGAREETNAKCWFLKKNISGKGK